MHFSKLFLPFACLHLQTEATTQLIGGVLPRFPSLGVRVVFYLESFKHQLVFRTSYQEQEETKRKDQSPATDHPRGAGNPAIGLHRVAGNPAPMEARNPGNPATNLAV